VSKSIEIGSDIIEKGIQKRNKVLAEAEERSQNIIKAAETEVARLNFDADRQILQIVGSELKTVRLRIVGQTELQGKKALMDKRSEILSKVYNQVEQRLGMISEGKSKDHDYAQILEKLVIEGVSAISDNEVIISANNRDTDYLKKNIKKISKALGGVNLRLAESPIDVLGGVVLKNSKGDKIFNNTFEGRLARAISETKAKTAKMLGMIENVS
jgi:vacuolar-type H+-ATPase subunit E/Vma4